MAPMLLSIVETRRHGMQVFAVLLDDQELSTFNCRNIAIHYVRTLVELGFGVKGGSKCA